MFCIAQSVNLVEVPGIACAAYTPKDMHLLEILEIVYLGYTLAIHTTLFVLTVSKLGKDTTLAHGGLWNFIWSERKSFPIITTLLRDGTLYFIIIFVFTIFLTWSSVDQKAQKHNIPSYFNQWYTAMLSFTGSRLIMKLRILTDVDSEATAPTLSRSIFFAQRDGTARLSEDESIGVA
ncbi:hypothetical protein BDQ17DRAFT_1422278 [Cyathus striatus]|nr:hypothetical protein BDQ17DRAFT_1422278 [Cyathus striatus]